MKYENIRKAVFIERPNRFIAYVDIDGKRELCHVKNTGRLGELLVRGAIVYVQKTDNPDRKTLYDLISVEKDGKIINIDSQAPNKVFGEWIESYFEGISYVKPEARFGKSRFDFYAETADRKIFVEIKGVTLLKDGVALFPDAPTERGIKHLNELCECVAKGYEAYVFFVVKAEGVYDFAPNCATHPAFAEALINARQNGVEIRAVNCRVGKDSLKIDDIINVKL